MSRNTKCRWLGTIAGLIVSAGQVDVANAQWGVNQSRFSPNSTSVGFAKTSSLIYFDRNLSGGAHTWIFNGSEVVKALNTYCGRNDLLSALLVQIRELLKPNRGVTATGGYQDQKQLGAAFMFLLAKNTPTVWNSLTAHERLLIDINMEALMYASVWGSKDTTQTGWALDGGKNYPHGNPNYPNGIVGMIIMTRLYFGESAMTTKLSQYDDAAFVAKLNRYGRTNLLSTFQHPNRPARSVVQTAIRALVNGDRYRYNGVSYRDPVGLFKGLGNRMFSRTINCGLHNGAGVQGYGKMIQNCSRLPNFGRYGMAFEFDSNLDSGGLRSSAAYVWDGWYVLNYSRAALQIAGLVTPATLASDATLNDIVNRYYLGSRDMVFKMTPADGGGYLNHANGKFYGPEVLDANHNTKRGSRANIDIFNILQRDLRKTQI